MIVVMNDPLPRPDLTRKEQADFNWALNEWKRLYAQAEALIPPADRDATLELVGICSQLHPA